MDHSARYSEPVKQQARIRVLSHAVRSLTTHRSSSPVVTADFFQRMLKWSCQLIDEHFQVGMQAMLDPLIQDWLAVHRARVGTKKAGELNVLILCGPNPENDIKVLMDLGVSSFNVWAVEGERSIYEQAMSRLKDLKLPLKVYCGSLKEFFSVVPQQFDIVYFDACGPLLGGKKSPTLPVIQELFWNQRLAPLSALITNFCAPNVPGSNTRIWSQRMATWYAPRAGDPIDYEEDPDIKFHEYTSNSDNGKYISHIEGNLELYYSHFIPSFISEFAGQLVPWWRIRALGGAVSEYFSSPTDRVAAIEASISGTDNVESIEEFLNGVGHAVLAPAAYRFLWISKLAENLGNDPLKQLFNDTGGGRPKLKEAVEVLSLLRNFSEVGSSVKSHNWEVCSPGLYKVLCKFKWFDSEGQRFHRLFCHDPMPELLADLFIGQIGYPFHVNAEKLLRLKYTARQNPMYCDVFILDQARYLYDSIPALPLFEEGLSVDLQMILRICVDGIARQSYEACDDIYKFGLLADDGELGYWQREFPARKTLRDLSSLSAMVSMGFQRHIR